MINHTPIIGRTNTRQGFTLIELIVYIALASIVLVALLQAMLAVLGAQGDTGGRADVHYALRYAAERIRRAGWNAESVNVSSSVFEANAGVLSLAMSGSILNPTVFSLSGNRIYLQEGTAAAQPLTPTTVTVDQLRFTRLTGAGPRETIHIVIHASEQTSGRPSSGATVRTSITLRQ